MSEFYIREIPLEISEELREENLWAYLLLRQIVERVAVEDDVPAGYKKGESHIGDFQKAGIPSEKRYRNAKKNLIERQIIEVVETCRTRKKRATGYEQKGATEISTIGTKVKLLNLDTYVKRNFYGLYKKGDRKNINEGDRSLEEPKIVEKKGDRKSQKKGDRIYERKPEKKGDRLSTKKGDEHICLSDKRIGKEHILPPTKTFVHNLPEVPQPPAAVNAFDPDGSKREMPPSAYPQITLKGKAKKAFEKLSEQQKEAFHLLTSVEPVNSEDEWFNPVTAIELASNTPFEMICQAIDASMQQKENYLKNKDPKKKPLESMPRLVHSNIKKKIAPLPEKIPSNEEYLQKWRKGKNESLFKVHSSYISFPNIQGTEIPFWHPHDEFKKRLDEKYQSACER